MRKLRCPKCGARNYEGYLEYPWCHKCGHPLVQCVYCAYLEPDGKCKLGHRYATSQLQTEPLDCADFWPSREYDLVEAKSPSLRPMFWGALALLVLIVALIVGFKMAQPQRVAPGVFSVQVLQTEPKGTKGLLELTIIARNDTVRVGYDSVILLDRRLLAGFELVGSIGVTGKAGLRDDWITIELGLLEALNAKMVKFRLKPRQAGEYPVRCELYVDGRQVASTRAVLKAQ